MAIAQPASGDALNSPDHALSHRIIAVDPAAAVQSIGVNSDNTISIKAGIIFPATAVPSADPNTIDDAEEGTWTPAGVLVTAGNSATSAIMGVYTKVGRLVTASGYFTFTKGTGTGVFTISGLPFPTGYQTVGSIQGLYCGAEANVLGVFILADSAILTPEFHAQSASNASNVQNTHMGNTAYIRLTISYNI